MNTSFWTPYISDGTIKAICWTLIHSLWIGMIIALLTGLVISFTRKSTAGLRYRLLCGILVLFVLSVSVTWFLEARSISRTQAAANFSKIIPGLGNNVTIYYTNSPDHPSVVNNAISFLDQNINIIFLVWALFFILKSLKMVSGLLYIQRIRNYKVHAVAEEFKHKIEMFSRQIGIRQTVRLVQSELVKVPVAVGWLKPVILLPMGVILQLSSEQLDSILWHELAHILRRDYVVNILQGLVETVFFFNPGLLWLSSLIRAEREACCDDMVLSRMNRKANYLEALLSFGYENNSRTSLAMSIGSGNQLRDRLKRMINQENKRLNMAEKIVLAAGLVLLLGFTTLPKTTQAMKYLSHLMIKKPVAGVISKLSNPTPAPSPNPPAPPFNKLRQLHIDTIVKKPDTAIRFTSVLFAKSDADLTNNDIDAMDDKGNRYHFIIADNKLVTLNINDVRVDDSKLAGYEYMVQYIDRTVAEKRRVRAEDIARFKAKWPVAKFKDNMFKHKYKDSMFKHKFKDSMFSKGKYVYGREAGYRNLKLEALKTRFRDDSVNYTTQRQRVQNVIADLVQEKVVPNAAAVTWFGLSNTEFLVNGQKQSDEMQQRYKAKYGIYEGNGLYYGPVEMHGVGVFIDVTDSRPQLPPRPGQPKGLHEPRAGYVQPKYTDTNAWKLRQLIKQQQLFATEQNDKRQQLIREQQVFAADQNEKRAQILKQQQLLVAAQTGKLPQQKLKLQKLRMKQMKLMKGDSSMRYGYRKSYNNYPLEPVIANVVRDLISENIIKDKGSLSSFKLTNTFLSVNGIKQPDAIHEKLRDKYLKAASYTVDLEIRNDPHYGLHYDAKNGDMGVGISINKNDP